jgi:hypothetical protein
MSSYIFTTPIVEEGPIGLHRLFYFFKLNKGVAIAKSGATYSRVMYPIDSDIATYDEFYRGGCNHTVNTATKTALIAAGVGVTEDNFTEI